MSKTEEMKETEFVLNAKDFKEVSEEGALEGIRQLEDKFLIHPTEIHNVHAIILDGAILKNRPLVTTKPPVLECKHENGRKIVIRRNYTITFRERHPFIIPDDTSLLNK